MKKLVLLLFTACFLLVNTKLSAQCANSATLTAGSLTPPGVGLSTTQTYGAGQYMLAFVSAGANYTVTTCGTSSYDTQLTVYNDATGAFYAYNDDFCGLQTSTSFTAPVCGYVRVLLHQYSCNGSGLTTPVTMTMNTAGTVPSLTSPAADVSTCSGVAVSIGNPTPATGGTAPYTYSWLSAAGLSSTTTAVTSATVTVPTTYTVTVTDANSCTVTDDVSITINAPPVVNLGADTAMCPSGTVIFDAGNAGSTYVWNDASVNQTYSATSSGLYYVTVTTPAGCVGNDSINLTINPLPVVDLGNDSLQCGGTILVDAGNAGSTYAWSTTETTQTVSLSATGSYTVTVTSPFGCQANDVINVTIDPLPVVNLGMDTAQCIGTVMIDAGNAGATYLWNDLTTAQTLTASASGTYYVTVTNSFSCSATDSINIAINALPVVNLGADTAQCEGTVVLDAGNAGFDFMWNDSTTMQTMTVSSTGNYAVLVTNPTTGCMQIDSIMVTINTNPVVNLGMDSTQCGGSITLDAGPILLATFEWNDSTTMQTLTAVSSGTYYVTVTDVNGCVSSDSTNLTINSIPVVALGADHSQCDGSYMIDAGNPGMAYSWYNSATTQTITLFSTDTASVTVTDTATGCFGMDTIIVTFGTYPVVNLGSDTTQCAGTVTLDADNAGSTFLWSDMSTSQTLSTTTSGTYSVSVTNAFGCATIDTIVVTINPLPVVGLSSFFSAVCLQAPSFTLTNGSPAGGVYSGTGVSAGMFNPATSGAGTFIVTYTITDGTTGCQNSSSQGLTINDCTGIEEAQSENAVSVYPNPANGMFNVSISNASFSSLNISINDLQGKEVYNSLEKGMGTEYNKQIDVTGLAKGIYYIKLNMDNNMTIKKLIVQ